MLDTINYIVSLLCLLFFEECVYSCRITVISQSIFFCVIDHNVLCLFMYGCVFLFPLFAFSLSKLNCYSFDVVFPLLEKRRMFSLSVEFIFSYGINILFCFVLCWHYDMISLYAECRCFAYIDIYKMETYSYGNFSLMNFDKTLVAQIYLDSFYFHIFFKAKINTFLGFTTQVFLIVFIFFNASLKCLANTDCIKMCLSLHCVISMNLIIIKIFQHPLVTKYMLICYILSILLDYSNFYGSYTFKVIFFSLVYPLSINFSLTLQ